MTNSQIAVIVLAAGKGTRMQSDLPKVLHEINGKPIILYTLEKLESMGFGQIIVVVGFGADKVKSATRLEYTYAFQDNPQGGTADAVKAGLEEVGNFKTLLVLNGDDSGFYKDETLEKFIATHIQSDSRLTILTTDKPQTERLGRIIRGSDNKFQKTMEAGEYEKSGLKSSEVNCGAYLFQTDWLKNHIDKIKNDNDKGEYRITELLNMAHFEGTEVGLVELSDASEWLGINTKEDLEKAKAQVEGK